MSAVNIILLDDKLESQAVKIQYNETSELRRKLRNLIVESTVRYLVFYHEQVSYEELFTVDFKRCFEQYNGNPDVLIWNRIHDYSYDQCHFESSWSSFHETYVLQREEFVQCFPVLLREYEALAFRGSCNRAYAREYVLANIDDILRDVDSSGTEEGFCSLANIQSVMLMDASVKVHKYCAGISLKEYWKLIETFYEDLLYVYRSWHKELKLGYGLVEIAALGAQYTVLQLNNMSYDPKYEKTGDKNLDIYLFLKDLDSFMKSEVFKDIVLFQPNSLEALFSELRKMTLLILSERAVNVMSDKNYSELLKQLCYAFPLEAVNIMLAQFYAQRNIAEHLEQEMLVWKENKCYGWVLWYLSLQSLLRPYMRPIKTQEDLEDLKANYFQIRASMPDTIVSKAFDTVLAVFDMNQELANAMIGHVEQEGPDCRWYYKICYLLCEELGIPEVGDDFLRELEDE